MKLDVHNTGAPYPGKRPGKRTMLHALVDGIHDHFVEMGRISFDQETGEWKWPYKKGISRQLLLLVESLKAGDGPYDHMLTVTGVKKYCCTDKAQINSYTINEVHFDRDNLQLKITAEPFVEIVLDVRPDFTISTE